jgi:hypothetical protein
MPKIAITLFRPGEPLETGLEQKCRHFKSATEHRVKLELSGRLAPYMSINLNQPAATLFLHKYEEKEGNRGDREHFRFGYANTFFTTMCRQT